MDDHSSQSSKSKEVPSWALTILKRIREIELVLGNLMPDGNNKVVDLDGLQGATDHNTLDRVVESLFAKIVEGLHKSSWTPAEIAGTINNHVASEKDRLPYCNEDEVNKVIADL